MLYSSLTEHLIQKLLTDFSHWNEYHILRILSSIALWLGPIALWAPLVPLSGRASVCWSTWTIVPVQTDQTWKYTRYYGPRSTSLNSRRCNRVESLLVCSFIYLCVWDICWNALLWVSCVSLIYLVWVIVLSTRYINQSCNFKRCSFGSCLLVYFACFGKKL